MSEHYFSKNPHSKSSPKNWHYNLRGRDFRFASDAGVFSRDTVDFGSRLLIESFTLPQVSGELLDLGCGYGPVGIALGGAYPERQIVMSDINERAVELARQNAADNGIENVEILQSDGFSNLKERSFAAILLNPPIRAGKSVIHSMFEYAAKAIIEGGEFWIVIQKKQGAPSAKEKLESLFGKVETVTKDKGYIIFKSSKV
ncbi:class I SAM-dependent methyltransferase [Aciduricibacillus chroicocephali]|uniref:Class I SAM-dependent methyltransferase n=1 Tax=Aciduricibacillus chroicocephali TaxID=3054939 RepID=A0ABY9KYX5_9BACI|nr:class I SAM-dependent methyltransferase [Bacillaceae bacterium 44XB]